MNEQPFHTCHDKCKRPMCVMRRERDEARAESLEQSRLLGMSSEREAKLLAQLAAERLLIRLLAAALLFDEQKALSGEELEWTPAHDAAMKAWKEARTPTEKKSDFS